MQVASIKRADDQRASGVGSKEGKAMKDYHKPSIPASEQSSIFGRISRGFRLRRHPLYVRKSTTPIVWFDPFH